MTLRPPLLDVLGARWALGSAVTAVAWSGGVAGFALADGTVALAPAPWQGAPALRRRREEGGGVELVPARGPPPPLARASVSRGPCLALAGTEDGFLCGASDGRLRRLAPDGKATKAAGFDAPVEAVAATGGMGWACIAGGRVHGDPPPPGAGDLAGATGLAWHPAAGLAVAHRGGVALCRGPAAEPLPGGAPAAVAVLAFSTDGRRLAGGPALWRLSPPAPAPVAPVALPGLSGPPAAAAFSAGGDLLALAGPEGARLWRVADGAAFPVAGGWQARGQASTALAFHPRRALLAAAYASGAVLLGPPDGGDAVLLRGASGADDGVAALAFSADGAWLAVGGAGGECALVALPDLLFRPGGTQPAAGTAEGKAP